MKIVLSANSQSEFDEKRYNLLKKLSGDKYDIISKASTDIPKKKGYFGVENEMNEYWNSRFNKMLDDIKNDINRIVGQK